MIRKFFLSSLIFIGICMVVQAQDGWSTQDYSYGTAQMDFKSKRVIPPSPDAAELGKYGNVPISLFTGTPNISIPLYELKGSALSLPISLSYNASGFKPQDIASWVGLGWALNAGGVITRSVLGNPDNSSNYFYANNNYQTLPPTDNTFANYDYMDSIQKGYKETQPDMYFFNFGANSGKFFLNTNQQVIRNEKSNLTITASGVSNDATGSSYFTIVDESGNTYLFNQTEISTMQLDDGITSTAPIPLSYTYPSSWFLSSITSADGTEVINFSYVNNSSSQSQYSTYLQNQSWSYYHNTLNYSSFYYEGSNATNGAAPPLVTLYHRRYLQGITLAKSGVTIASVSLTLAAGQRLDLDQTAYAGERMPQSLTVNSYIGQVKKFNFYYGYFGGTNPDGRRLRLDSVSEVAATGSGLYKPPYSFVYDQTGSIVAPSSASIDHWGFANGGSVTTLVPYYQPGDGHTYGGGAIRDPNLSGSQTAILKQINYPTGGYTSFAYELNQTWDDQALVNRDVGGLRIQEMIDYSFPGKPAVRKVYSYLQSSGIPSGKAYFPTYVSFSSFHHYAEVVLGQCILPACTKTTPYDLNMVSISASSIAGLGSIAGSHIGYEYVTETQTDVNTGVYLGKTSYHYFVGTLGVHNDFIGNGDLLDKCVYDGTGKLLDHHASTYNYANGDGGFLNINVSSTPAQDNYNTLCKYLQGSVYVYSWKGDWQTSPACSSSRIYKNKFRYLTYVTSGQWKQLTAEVDTLYDQASNAYTVTTKKYTYGSTAHTMPTLLEQYSSSNDEIVTSKKYAGDYSIPGSGTFDNATNGIKLLQTKNMMGQEVETLVYRQNQDGSNKRYIDGTLIFYDPVYPRPTNSSRLELSAPAATLTTSTTNGTFTYDPSYKALGILAYDGYGNLNEQSRSLDIVKAYIWDYNHSLPAAEVINASASMVAYCGFENGTGGGNWAININGLTAGGRAGVGSYNLSSTYLASVSGMPSTRTYVVSYWLHSGSLTVTTNTGTASGVTGVVYNGWTYVEHVLPAGSTQVTLSSAGGANLDELRLFPQDALMTTNTYMPLIGLTSQCTPTNQYAFYQYDGFYRLWNVLDMGGNIVKNFKYNYGLGAALTPSVQTLFYSGAKSGSYTKQGCLAPTEPTTVTYYVPFGKYVSSIKQDSADAKAQADVIANGQNYANSIGQCLYWNVVKSGSFTKTCAPQDGSPACDGGSKPFTIYTVLAHTYSSPLSQGAADTLALNAVAANGPGYADNHCICSCTGQGKKVVAGACETGTRVNSSSTHMPDGTWQCVFYYQFSDGSTSVNYTEYNSTACPIL